MRLQISVVFLLVAIGARGDALTDAEMAKREMIERRALELQPRRRDSPLRYANINDIEVREIQRLAASVNIRELLNISGVVTGCACEEGPDCTEQVYVVGKYKDRVIGMEFSRLRNRWSIGRVQRWWIEYAQLRARESRMERREYEKARSLRLAEFPVCILPSEPAATAKN